MSPKEGFIRMLAEMDGLAKRTVTWAEKQQANRERRDRVRDDSGRTKRKLKAIKQGGIEAAKAIA